MTQKEVEKIVRLNFDKYYEYVHSTDDGEQRGEWRNGFVQKTMELINHLRNEVVISCINIAQNATSEKIISGKEAEGYVNAKEQIVKDIREKFLNPTKGKP